MGTLASGIAHDLNNTRTPSSNFCSFFTTKKSSNVTESGLSTVHSILKNHGGFIPVESKLGQGAEFSCD